MEDVEIFRGRKESFKWVKAADGEEYLCPSNKIAGHHGLTDKELGECVSDTAVSVNPRGG